jgi:hypothetical protein
MNQFDASRCTGARPEPARNSESSIVKKPHTLSVSRSKMSENDMPDPEWTIDRKKHIDFRILFAYIIWALA